MRLFVFLLTYACLTVICNAAQNLYSEDGYSFRASCPFKDTEGFHGFVHDLHHDCFIAGEKAVPRLIVAQHAIIQSRWRAYACGM